MRLSQYLDLSLVHCLDAEHRNGVISLVGIAAAMQEDVDIVWVASLCLRPSPADC